MKVGMLLYIGLPCTSDINDSVLGKRVLTYWENWGNLGYSQMNVFIVAMENYIFFERGRSHLSKNV